MIDKWVRVYPPVKLGQCIFPRTVVITQLCLSGHIRVWCIPSQMWRKCTSGWWSTSLNIRCLRASLMKNWYVDVELFIPVFPSHLLIEGKEVKLMIWNSLNDECFFLTELDNKTNITHVCALNMKPSYSQQPISLADASFTQCHKTVKNRKTFLFFQLGNALFQDV